MRQTSRSATALPSLAVPLALSLSVLQPAIADTCREREQLTAVTRQIDLIDRMAERAATTASQASDRYYFDYARLRADVERMRAGIQAYLSPSRAQPRDSAELLGDYRQPAAGSPEAEFAP